MNGSLLVYALLFAATSTATHPRATIKTFGVFGPVTGGNETPGRVDLEITGAMLTPVISLQSSHPSIASVPATTRPTIGDTAIFMVKVEPVLAATEVTITATLGASVKTANLTILPPKLTQVACDQPPNVYPTKPLWCTVWLDGKVPLDTNVQLASTAPDSRLLGFTTVVKGSLKGRFQVGAAPIGQSTSGEVSATYAGVTKSTPIKVMPVALKDFTIQPSPVEDNVIDVRLLVTLTAPAPASALNVRLSGQVMTPSGAALPLDLPGSLTVLAGKENGVVVIRRRPVGTTTSVTITASSDFFGGGDAREATVKFLPPTLKSLLFPTQFSNVPLGGVPATVTVGLTSLAAASGALIDLRYAGDTQVTGPARVEVKPNALEGHVTVTVSPCSVKPTCSITITASHLGHEVSRTATVAR